MLNERSLWFVLFMAALASLPPLSIDMGLPALHSIAVGLHTTLAMSSLTLTLFLVGFAAMPLIYGPVSDRLGRKPVLLFGVGMFVVSGAAAVAAPSIDVLLAVRLVQGAGAGVGMSLAFAIIRDRFQGDEARSKLSYVQMITSPAPLIAPSIGALLLLLGNWRLIYGVLCAIGLALLAAIIFVFKETHPRAPGTGGIFSPVVAGYLVLARSRLGVGFTLIYALNFGVQFSFIAGSPLVFMGVFGVSATAFGAIFGISAFGATSGAFVNTRLSKHHVSGKIPLITGFALYLLTSCTMLLLARAGLATAGDLCPLIYLSSLAFGLIGPNASHGTLQAVPTISGIAGGMLASLQMTVAIIASAVVAMLFAPLGIYAMLLPMLGFGLVVMVIYVVVVRPAEAAEVPAVTKVTV